METIKQIVPELIKAQALDPEDLIEALTVKSMTELRNNVGNSLKEETTGSKSSRSNTTTIRTVSTAIAAINVRE